MAYLPTDIVARAFDAAGVEYVEGDLQDGTRPMQVALRSYGECLRQLLRAANWDFARRTAPLQLLADASGQTANVGSIVPYGTFQYEYAYPTDCAKVRFIPQNYGSATAPIPSDNIQIPTTPLTSVGTPISPTPRMIPARFVIATDPNYPPQAQPSASFIFGSAINITGATNASPCVITAPSHGLANGNLFYLAMMTGMTELNGGTWQAANVTTNTLEVEDADGNAIDATAFGIYVSGGTLNRVQPALVNPNAPGQGQQFWEVQGVSPQGRTVILTNVQNAQCVYTQIMLYPSTWDPLFRMAMVAYLASEVAFPLATWKSQHGEFLKRQQMGMAIRRDQIAIAKDKIREARAVDGNEGWSTNDHIPDWVTRRNSGGGWGGANTGIYGVGAPNGGWGGGCGWDACGFADGTAF